jgi:tetratricopeptide (TPR) repeat protein
MSTHAGRLMHESLHDEYAEAVLQRAKALVRHGDPDGSETMFRRLLTSPRHASIALYGIGVARLAAGDLSSARSFFQKTLDREPTHANALYQLGFISEKNGAKEEAIAFYEAALSAFPGHISARQRLRTLCTPPAPARPAATLWTRCARWTGRRKRRARFPAPFDDTNR